MQIVGFIIGKSRTIAQYKNENNNPDIKFLQRLFTEINSSFSKNIKHPLQEHRSKESDKIHKELSSTYATFQNNRVLWLLTVGLSDIHKINLLDPELFFLILAHPVYKM